MPFPTAARRQPLEDWRKLATMHLTAHNRKLLWCNLARYNVFSQCWVVLVLEVDEQRADFALVGGVGAVVVVLKYRSLDSSCPSLHQLHGWFMDRLVQHATIEGRLILTGTGIGCEGVVNELHTFIPSWVSRLALDTIRLGGSDDGGGRRCRRPCSQPSERHPHDKKIWGLPDFARAARAGLSDGAGDPWLDFCLSTTLFHFLTRSLARLATAVDSLVRSLPTARPAFDSYIPVNLV